MNAASLITKGLRFRPQRTAFLLLGFAVAVMVMTVLLSVGSAVLDQAMDEDLTGGGNVVLLPVGIDVDVLKTGGVTAMHFDIANARYLTREFLTRERIPDLRVASPELTRAHVMLAHGGEERLVRVDGVVPSRFAQLWPAWPAFPGDGPGEREYIDPDFVAMLAAMDAFHPPVIDSTQTWAEWHYFNYHDELGRSLYVSINAIVAGDDIAPGGYSRGIVLFEYVDEAGRQIKLLDTLPGREVSASHTTPDLVVGLNTVRFNGGIYEVNVALTDSLSRPVTVSLELEPTPHQYVPAVTPMGSEVAFGYVVPVIRGRMTGRVTMGGRTVELAGTGYHDHNWGHFRDAVWDWGIVHAGPYSVLYGRFATSSAVLARQPVLAALFDARGPRPFALTSSYAVEWGPGGASAVDMRFCIGTDSLTLHIDVSRRFVSQTGGGEEPLFRADADGHAWFHQLEGRARLTGRLDGATVDSDGHAYAETFSVVKADSLP